jgi:hypothetical protein
VCEEDDMKQGRSLIYLGFGENDFKSGDLPDCFEYDFFMATNWCT